MSNVAHSGLTSSNLHENKGVAAASDDTVLTVTSGATVVKKLTNNNLLYGQLFHVREQKLSNVASSFTPTVSTWSKVIFDTTMTNEISSATLTTSVVSLPAGTYEAEAYCAGVEDTTAYVSKLRLRNTTDSATLVVGRSVGFQAGAGILILPQTTLKGRFTIGGTKNIELQYWNNSSSAPVGGSKSAGSAEVEIYSELYIKRIS